MKELNPYKVRTAFADTLWQTFLRMLNSILNVFSLRQTKQFWGIVYDSASKQPLDPVIVKLLYADGGEIATCVTDLAGRYGFLARPGKFKIFARKTNYQFPSKFVSGDEDGIYKNLYHGEFFVLKDSSEVVAPNIPMDEVRADWNQAAKRKVLSVHAYGKLLVKRFFAVAFWTVFIWLILEIFIFRWPLPVWLWFGLGIYGLLIACAAFLPEPRLWGKLILPRFFNFEGKLYLELSNQKFPGMVFGKAELADDLRFLLRSNPGTYTLSLCQIYNNEKTVLAQAPVRVSRLGVYNHSIQLSERK